MTVTRVAAATIAVAAFAAGTTIAGWAGGWAVVTLDALPEGVVPGEPFTVGFTVRRTG